MEQLLLAYGLPNETVAAIMMIYKTRTQKFANRMETQTSLTLLLVFHKGLISPITVHNLPKLRNSKVGRSNERKWFYAKKQEIDDTPRKVSRTLITQQIHLLKPNSCCVIWSMQQMALASMWMQGYVF